MMTTMRSVGAAAAMAAMAAVLGGCSVDVDTSAAGVPTGSVGVRPYTTLPASSETAASVTWSSSPTAYRGRNGLRVKYDCPGNGSEATVWGTDIYTDDSSVCNAAVHFGRISVAAGGSVVIEIRAGLASYAGTVRNGVSSTNYGEWPGSFIVL
jgi:hypothetical protein